MNNGFAVIDADRHVMEPSDLWDRYLRAGIQGTRENNRTFSVATLYRWTIGIGFRPAASRSYLRR